MHPADERQRKNTLVRLHTRLDEMAARQARIEAVLVRLAAGRRLDVLTSADVMHLLSIGRTKLHALIASGDLPMWKLGGEWRITRAELEAFIQRHACS